jgi:hypothetical protein
MILKGIALTGAGLGGFLIGKRKERANKKKRDKQLNKRVAQVLATNRNVQRGRV